MLPDILIAIRVRVHMISFRRRFVLLIRFLLLADDIIVDMDVDLYILVLLLLCFRRHMILNHRFLNLKLDAVINMAYLIDIILFAVLTDFVVSRNEQYIVILFLSVAHYNLALLVHSAAVPILLCFAMMQLLPLLLCLAVHQMQIIIIIIVVSHMAIDRLLAFGSFHHKQFILVFFFLFIIILVFFIGAMQQIHIIATTLW
mmetsp:Transcript_72151/g.115019  ORF Transcript_72151/g.115019 Transcript_72151/m.115019 type:complete len:201 (-) Transcript_72151:682-1284(-)